MLLEKYSPRSVSDCIGNKKQADEIRSFVRNFRRGKALILSGPPGCGKSLAVLLVAKELGCELAEYSRLESDMKSFLKSMNQKSFFFKGKIVVADLDAEGERSMQELVNVSQHPVIFMAGNAYDYRIRASCAIVKFQKINYLSIASFLRRVCEAEKIKYEEKALLHLARQCDGDIRSALIDLESAKEISYESIENSYQRSMEENIFNTLKVIFKTTSMENVFSSIEASDMDSQQLLSWLHENVADEYENIEDVSAAYESLSFADLFYSRTLRRQAMSLRKYGSIGIAGVSLSKKGRYSKFFVYKAPRYRKDSTEPVLEKISARLCISKKRARSYVILARAMKKKAADVFDFDESEIKTLKSISESKVTVYRQ